MQGSCTFAGVYEKLISVRESPISNCFFKLASDADTSGVGM